MSVRARAFVRTVVLISNLIKAKYGIVRLHLVHSSWIRMKIPKMYLCTQHTDDDNTALSAIVLRQLSVGVGLDWSCQPNPEESTLPVNKAMISVL